VFFHLALVGKHLDHGGGKLVKQNFMVGQILNEFLEEEGKTSATDRKK
jgi:hypothetical protein